MKAPRILPILLVLLAGISCARGSKNSDDESQAAEIEPCPLGFSTKNLEVDSLSVKSGDSFATIMGRLGLGAQNSYTLTQLCDTLIDLRKIKAGNSLEAYYEVTDSTKTLAYVVFEQSRVRSTVFRCIDSLAVWNVDKPVSRERLITDVTINSSLWNDMLAAGGSPNLIMNLADIYQWSVNFFTLQKGDRFQIIYSQSLCEGEVIAIDTVHFSLFTACEGKQVGAVRFSTDEGGKNTYWDKGGVSLKRMFLKAPLRYNRISSRFSYHRKHPVTGKVKAHTAVDYAAPKGTEVYAIGDGTITLCGWDATGGGNRIKIKHMQGYESSYMHLSRFASGIRAGVRVSQGQLIGYVGATGTATGPHLDFRIWEKGRPIDPLSLNSPASEPLNKKYLDVFNDLWDKYIAEIGGENFQSADSVSVAPTKAEN